MKTIVVAFVALLATTIARPQDSKQLRNFDDIVQEFVTEFIKELVIDAVEEINELTKKSGLDPYVVVAGEYSVDGSSGRVDNFLFTGLSNIVVNSVSFSGSDLVIDISLPRLAISVDNFIGDMTIGGRNIQSEFSGSMAFVDLRLIASRSMEYSVNLNDWTLSPTIGGIDAEFSNFVIQGQDVTDRINNFFVNILPNLLKQDEEPFNSFFEGLVREQLL